MTAKAQADSIRQRLLKKSAKAGVSFSNLETAFLIERLVARLTAEERLRKSLIFKGGFVSLRVYESSRYTVDLDALLVKADLEKTLELARAAAENDIQDGVWFQFERQIDLATQGEYGGIRQIYRAGIGEKMKNVKKAQIINFDLGIGDPVTPGPFAADTKMLLSDRSLSWSVYPVETIIAEKLHVIAARNEANSRSKDIYDLAIFLPRADMKVLKEALRKCFAFRKTELPPSFANLLKGIDTTVLERGWPSAVASVPGAPKFKTVFDQLISLVEALDQ
jgi:predicted nucleotidyltransferase component of viral defense system